MTASRLKEVNTIQRSYTFLQAYLGVGFDIPLVKQETNEAPGLETDMAGVGGLAFDGNQPKESRHGKRPASVESQGHHHTHRDKRIRLQDNSVDASR